MFTRLAHICLNVRDLQRSVEFYNLLGFKTVFRFTRNGSLYGAYLQIAPSQFIEMFESPEQAGPSSSGIAHFCLESADLQKTAEQLQTLGIEFTPIKRGCDQTDQIWLKDPDGNAFEVHQYSTQSSQFNGKDCQADW